MVAVGQTLDTQMRSLFAGCAARCSVPTLTVVAHVVQELIVLTRLVLERLVAQTQATLPVAILVVSSLVTPREAEVVPAGLIETSREVLLMVFDSYTTHFSPAAI